MGWFTDEQHNLIMQLLLDMFCRRHQKVSVCACVCVRVCACGEDGQSGERQQELCVSVCAWYVCVVKVLRVTGSPRPCSPPA